MGKKRPFQEYNKFLRDLNQERKSGQIKGTLDALCTLANRIGINNFLIECKKIKAVKELSIMH
jgi:hypothetical protein